MTIGRRRPYNWGAKASEIAATYPCDAELPESNHSLYRAVSVGASPAVVFRWLCQLRVAPYSYDLLDNFGRQSPRQLTPGVEELVVGQRVMRIFALLGFEPGTSLTVQLDHRPSVWLFGDAVVTYRVDPTNMPNQSRLAVKIAVRHPETWLSRIRVPLLAWGDLFMMRKQLLTLKMLAEQSQSAGRTAEIQTT